jgi:hypothetical protein
MNQKQVVQLDQGGYFVGVTTADESPLEPGVFHMPAGTIEATPPFVPAGKRVKWIGSGWVAEDIPRPPKPNPGPGFVVEFNEVTGEWDVMPEPVPEPEPATNEGELQ